MKERLPPNAAAATFGRLARILVILKAYLTAWVQKKILAGVHDDLVHDKSESQAHGR